ncbi:MAG TPA: histidine phosphatase family protein [Rhizomicrobium sp.]
MKRLLLLRHAKAERGGHGAGDKLRALAPRGREDAARLGRFLNDEAYIAGLVLCSASARTRETLELILPQIDPKPAVQYLDELYLAEAETILELMRGTREAIGSLMIVGHNPGLEECARSLVRPPAERNLRKRYQMMAEKFPTGSLAVIDFQAERWRAIGGWVGELEIFVRPKDLREE